MTRSAARGAGGSSFFSRLWRNAEWSVGTKLILLTVPLIALLSLVAAYTEHVRNVVLMQERLAHRAKSLAHQIMADRQYYASIVVPRVKDLGGTLGSDYREVHGRFPLPATFVREASEITASIEIVRETVGKVRSYADGEPQADDICLDYISSAGLRVLLMTAKKLKGLTGRIVLASLKNHIREVFDIAGFSAIFPIYDQQDAAVGSFQ